MIFGDYDEYPTDILYELMVKRGIELDRGLDLAETKREDIIKKLEALDRAIDLKEEKYKDFSAGHLVDLGVRRGIKASSLMDPTGYLPGKKERILQLLAAYEDGTLSPKDVGWDTERAYEYGQERYRHQRGLQEQKVQVEEKKVTEQEEIREKEIEDNYKVYSQETLERLMKERGVETKASTRRGMMKKLEELDFDIEITEKDYKNYSLRELIRLAAVRGISVEALANIVDVQELATRPKNDPGKKHERQGLFKLLKAYEEGTIDQELIGDFEHELRTYKYAQQRYARKRGLEAQTPPKKTVKKPPPAPETIRKLGKEKGGPVRRITFDDEPQIPGKIEILTRKEIQKMTIPELKNWLDNHGISRVGITLKADFVELVAQHMNDVTTTLTQDAPDVVAKGKGTTKKGVTTTTTAKREPKKKTTTKRGPKISSKEIRDALMGEPILATYDGDLSDLPVNVEEIVDYITAKWFFYDYKSGIRETPIETIMRSETATVDRVLKQFGFENYIEVLSYREKIDVLWAIYAVDPIKSFVPLLKLSPKSVKKTYPELSKFSNYELAVFLSTGGLPFPLPFVPNEEALAKVDEYTPKDIVKIVKYLYRFPTPFEKKPINRYSYYQVFISRDPSILIPFIIDWDEGDPSEIAESMGMIIPPGFFEDALIRTNYFIANIEDYTKIYIRPDPIEPPPIFEDIPQGEIIPILSQYTDDELLNAYEVTFDDWGSRRELLQKIASEGTGGAKWSFRKKYCNNLERTNPITLDIPIPLDDPEDPILSYGTLTNYRCYQVSELETTFFEDKEVGFVFSVPDYIDPAIAATLTRIKYPLPDFREFPLASIRQLKTLLTGQKDPKYKELLQKISEGIDAKNAIHALIKRLRTEYLAFPKEWQESVRDYIFWLFFLGMRMRFWKGPGFPFPMKWLETGGEDRCEYNVRDKNVEEMFGMRTTLLGEMDPELEKWILQFPRIRYDFITGAVAAGAETINFIIEEAQQSNFCIADASDHILRTSYYLALSVLGLSNDDFNAQITEILETPDQPPFSPEAVTGTGHQDPYHILHELE